MLEVRLCVGNRRGGLYWNSTAASFVPLDQRTIFTSFKAAQEVAKECRGRVNFDGTCDAVRVVEFAKEATCVEGQAPVERVYDILESVPTRKGNVPPILISAVERALERGNRVEVSVVKYEGR